ncbi:MAG: HAD hydrolase-like protein [Clostridia bacterium]|nr:HAD hydrolase-like protein [Clostridia bacterium]
MYKYIFFDLDGTLTNSEEGIIRSLEYAFDELGLERPSYELLKKFIGPPLVVSFRDYMSFDEELTAKAIEKYRERYIVTGIFENAPYDGIAELLKELVDNGFRLAVATTKPEYMALKVTDHYDLTSYFETVSGAIGENDTKEAVIRRVCERMNIPESEWNSILMVGDRKFDVIGAHDCGIKCCGVRYGFAPEGECEECGADYIVTDVADLKKFLLN